VIRTLLINANAVIPENITIEMMPIAAIVRAAFRALGLRNAGTPLEIASTPVKAVHPEEKDRNSRNTNANPVNPALCAWIE